MKATTAAITFSLFQFVNVATTTCFLMWTVNSMKKCYVTLQITLFLKKSLILCWDQDKWWGWGETIALVCGRDFQFEHSRFDSNINAHAWTRVASHISCACDGIAVYIFVVPNSSRGWTFYFNLSSLQSTLCEVIPMRTKQEVIKQDWHLSLSLFCVC